MALSNNQFLFLTLSLVCLDKSADLDLALLSSNRLAFASTLKVRTGSLGWPQQGWHSSALCGISLSSG